MKESEPVQASKNLKDYDCWDQDLKPEEWLEKYQGKPGPHGKSPIYQQGEYKWADVELLDYDKPSGKFYVKVLQNGLLKFVSRLAITFADEDSGAFEQRVAFAKQRQRKADNELKLQKYIDQMSSSLVSEIPKNIVDNLSNRKTFG